MKGPSLSVLALLLFSHAAGALPPQDGGDGGVERWGVKRLLEHHLSAKGGMTARDAYKLLFQACFGVEHLLSDTAGVRARLLAEMETLGAAAGPESLLERISPDGAMVRLNLRPAAALNLPPEAIVQAMFRSAAETRPDTLAFYRYWNETTALIRYALLPWRPSDLVEWDARVQEGDLRPAHHSEEYRKANRPAYRVVRRDVIEEILGRHRSP